VPKPPAVVEDDEIPMYDVVSDSGSDGETARLLKRAKEEGPSEKRRRQRDDMRVDRDGFPVRSRRDG